MKRLYFQIRNLKLLAQKVKIKMEHITGRRFCEVKRFLAFETEWLDGLCLGRMVLWLHKELEKGVCIRENARTGAGACRTARVTAYFIYPFYTWLPT